ncbi:hypothetical protein [Actinomadura madurae]|uniref:hypothetical protein n=1 Tax=Actinomadura madurae TaxID=1993 RepID=UPI0020D223B9|nr:hypothetical protein [Actinomadura madurae]MCQ0015433.1 hypothetical protein [Actinomadura madurae]
MRLPADDEHAALFTVGQVADMLHVRQAFLRRIDEHQVVSPQRSAPAGSAVTAATRSAASRRSRR